MRILNDDQKRELDRLKQWSMTILDFISKFMAPNERLNYYEKYIEIINQAHEEENLTGLKMIVRDITEWAKGLNQIQIRELNQILRKKFGDDLHYNKRKIDAILAKGIIEKQSEYKLLFDYFEQIHSDASINGEIDKVKNMLEHYQGRTGKV